MKKKPLLVAVALLFLFVFPVQVYAVNYTVGASLGRNGVDFWRISGVTKGDDVSVAVSVTATVTWTSAILSLNLTKIDTQKGLGNHNIHFQANETGDLLLEIDAPSSQDISYNIASSHTLASLPKWVGGGSLAQYQVTYWEICNVTKGDLVSIVTNGNWYFAYGTVLSYPSLGVAASQSSNGAHVMQFYANESGDMQLKVTSPAPEGMAYDIRSTHPIALEDSLISSFFSDKSVVNQGELVTVNLVLTNLGIASSDAFNVTANYDSSVIQKITCNGITPFEAKNLEFQWNTANVQPGNYTLSALISAPTNGQEWSLYPNGETVSYSSNVVVVVKNQSSSQTKVPGTSPISSNGASSSSTSPQSSPSSSGVSSMPTSSPTSSNPGQNTPTPVASQQTNQTQSSSQLATQNQFKLGELIVPLVAVLVVVGSASSAIIIKRKRKDNLIAQKSFPETSNATSAKSSGLVFISHAEEDSKIAEEIARSLESSGYKTWYFERDNLPGQSYISRISDAIQNSLAVIVIISKDTFRSREVHTEIVKTHQTGGTFIPVLYDITFDEFKRQKDEWSTMFGLAAAVAIPRQGVQVVMPRIVAGLEAIEAQDKNEETWKDKG